jgi:uncharacterized protein with FMN-binding domain
MATPRVHPGLVALSASAIAAVYMAGYLRTQSADASIGAAAEGASPVAQAAAATPAAPAVVVMPPPTARPTAQASAPAARAARAAPTAPTPAAPATQAGYKDGTYTGQGTSRRGGVEVSILVQGGQIASVTITQSTLQYPLRDIAGLPAQVVQRQSAQVDTVSRATYSSQAFRGAVAQALSRAA